jgi:hypothetical protein
MLLAHLHHLLKVGVACWSRFGGAAGIVGAQSCRAALGEAPHQMTHGSLREAARFRQMGHGLAFLKKLPDGLPHRDRNWGRHE